MTALPNLFSALDSATEAALRESIRRFGVLVPVVRDQHGRTLDGHHRSRIADEESVRYRVDLVTVADDDEAREISVTLNADRRQLTAEQVRDHVRMLRAAGHSQGATAKAAGVTQGRVSQIESELISANELTVPERAVGLDGKSRPAKRPTIVAAKDEREAGRAQTALASFESSGETLTATDVFRRAKESEREAKRDENRGLVEQAPSLASVGDRFSTIVLDPPWDWGDEGDVDQMGRATPTYATMPLEELAEQPIEALAEQNAHLYLWITNRSLPKGFALLERWGFRYVTMLTWVKPSIGMGNYFRGSTEQVLFGVRGSLPLLRSDVGTHFAAKRPAEHSQKPVEFYELVESCSPGPWFEWPARRTRGGWVVSGAEVAA